MNRFVVALLVLPLGQSMALAQSPAGDAQAGKEFWDGPTSQCRNCHGTNGEGAFGPDLAGRKLTVAQFAHAVRKPWGIMPAYIDSQVSDAEIANLSAYFSNLPNVSQPGKWRFEVPTGAPRGQVTALNVGCAQCHGPILDGPRANMGAVDGDFDWFKSQVYDHTTALPQHAKLLDERPPARLRMGNFNPYRVWESQLQDIYAWARDLGPRARITGRLAKGMPANNGVSYTLNVENGGLPGKAPTAEDLTIRLIVPNGTDVVAATGAGYQGVRMDEQAKANVAVWQVSQLAPKEHQSFTITLSKAGTAADNLRGDVRWTKPVVKTGPFDRANIAAAPL